MSENYVLNPLIWEYQALSELASEHGGPTKLVRAIYDEGHEDGYGDGYNDGLVTGIIGTITTLAAVAITAVVIDEGYPRAKRWINAKRESRKRKSKYETLLEQKTHEKNSDFNSSEPKPRSDDEILGEH